MNRRTNAVRPSRDGHEYHEAWVARRALGLLLPRDQLVGIAVEGLAPEDEEGTADATVEIADATFYCGADSRFIDADTVEVTQFKYSPTRSDQEVRFADCKKTLQKFIAADADFRSKHGDAETRKKVSYALVTNRPISPSLLDALRAVRTGETSGEGLTQAQFQSLTDELGLEQSALQAFCSRLAISGSQTDLADLSRQNERLIADWSASDDVLADARLGKLRKLVREKAGMEGADGRNVIRQVDVLDCLGLSHEDELLPAPAAFPEVTRLVQRQQLQKFLARLGSIDRWLVHAEGGVGKTVFVQSVAVALAEQDEVVLFDCFGGGAYRSPIDKRHLPERGLLHVVNVLACKGLCDPILPGSSDSASVIRRSLDRFQRTIETLRRTRPSARLVVILDAADNAGLEATDRHQSSFPRDLLEALTHAPAVDGLIVIATARTHRREVAIGRAQCEPFELEAFAADEAQALIVARRPEATVSQVDSVFGRSGGNPRVIASLTELDRSLDFGSGPMVTIHVDELIQDRIDRAIAEAQLRGADAKSVETFLCGLSALPPPAPMTELANAFGISAAEIESFAADLAPLLERTRHGLIFRDEPTETLVRERYGSKLHLLESVVGRLTGAQTSSVYASRALPGLLFKLGKTEGLHQLALSDEFPASLDSDVARRTIRLNRLRTAIGSAAKAKNYDVMVDLLSEQSTLAAVDERDDTYLSANPDLVIASGDEEALRRLFETRVGWPGGWHARLAIAYTADGDTAEAYVHAKRSDEWLGWLSQQDARRSHEIETEVEDYVAVPFYWAARGLSTNVARYIARWHPNWAYRISVRLVDLCRVSAMLGRFPEPRKLVTRLSRCRGARGPLIAAAFEALPDLDAPTVERLVRRLATSVATGPPPQDDHDYWHKDDTYRLALLRAALLAARLGLREQVESLVTAIAPRRYSIWALEQPWHSDDVPVWALAAAAMAAARGTPPTLFECLPVELAKLVEAFTDAMTDEEQSKAIDKALTDHRASRAARTSAGEKEGLSESELYAVPKILSRRVAPTLQLAKRVYELALARDDDAVSAKIAAVFDAWTSEQKNTEGSYPLSDQQRFIDSVHISAIFHALSAFGAFTPQTAEALIDNLDRAAFAPPNMRTAFVHRFAVRPDCAAHAGRIAVETQKAIRAEEDTVHRAQSTAALARAILPASRDEARSLFKAGLAELTAIGSGDYRLVNELLLFASTVREGPSKPALSQRLAKICELNIGDEAEKFPWVAAGAAFARVAGVSHFAQLARWQDRERVDLEWTLPPLLTALLRDGAITAADTVATLALVRPMETWSWNWANVFEALVASKAPDLEAVLLAALDHFERCSPKRVRLSLWDEINAALKPTAEALPAISHWLTRLQSRIAVREPSGSSSSFEPKDTEATAEAKAREKRTVDALVSEADPLNAQSIERLVAAIDDVHGRLDLKSYAFTDLRAKVGYADRGRHIGAIVAADNLPLFAKTELLKAVRAAWLADSPTGLSGLGNAAAQLARQHAPELLESDWGFGRDLADLGDLSGAEREDLATELVTAATGQDIDVSATGWLNLATILSSRAGTAVARSALERLLNSEAVRLADEVGEGVWRDEFDPGMDAVQCIAGLVWSQLGSPKAETRWLAAHAVRMFARVGRWQIIDALFRRLAGNGAGAFQAEALPFFTLHARQWFLLAVTRLAIDFPSEIARHAESLRSIAFDGAFPHIGLREAAKRALLECKSEIIPPMLDEEVARLDEINRSPFERVLRKGGRIDPYTPRPQDAPPHAMPEFRFDYDFDKYRLSGLGDLFGIPKWQAADLCVKWIRTLDAKIDSMHDFAGRRSASGRDYSRGVRDDEHSYGTYLVWHALALASGELLLSRPVVVDDYDPNAWDDWLNHYRATREDGRWMSDGTSPYPLYALQNLSVGDDQVRTPTDDEAIIAALVGLPSEGELPGPLVIDGYWESPDDVSVHVSSVLVPTAEAGFAALALATALPHDKWLPDLIAGDDEDEVRYGIENTAPCEAWVADRDIIQGLDERDPFASVKAVARSRPELATLKALGLWTGDPFVRIWRAPDGTTAFRSDGWGFREGMSERETHETGHSLVVEPGTLGTLLSKRERSLLLLLKLQYYNKKMPGASSGDGLGSFRYSSLIATIDPSLKVEIVRPSQALAQAVAALPNEDRRTFTKRLAVILSAAGA